MPKLNVDQKTIRDLLSDRKADFLIPDYQRPYAWSEDQCQTLWDDLFMFAIPDEDYAKFDDNEEYFLGSIVTYKNKHNREECMEVIDGQQRLTTLMLILRAFYDKFELMKDNDSRQIRRRIEECIWKTDAFGNADKSKLKINSEVATDNDKEEFLELLRTGRVERKSKSQYLVNYQFFQKKIEEFQQGYASCFPYLPARMLNNCILLPIEAESQDTALRIFSTLNDRGLPLADADIFKAQFYKYYGDKGQKDDFIEDWRGLEETAGSISYFASGSPMDDLFTRYMYFLRARNQNRSTTTEALRKFYEQGKYKYFKNDCALHNLKSLASFWQSVSIQDKERFSEDILKKFFVLTYAPNGMWENMVSVYFLQNRDDDESLEESSFIRFLDKITAFIFTWSITNPGLSALRTPAFDEMANIAENKEISFSKYKFNEKQTRSSFKNQRFANQRKITRSMVTWHAFTHPLQQLPDLKENFHIEHIYPGKRQEMEQGLQSESSLESLGNKVLLEGSINIKASDYRFDDKKKIYTGELRRGKNRTPSKVFEVSRILEYSEFGERQIQERSKRILDEFFDYLRKEDLLSTAG